MIKKQYIEAPSILIVRTSLGMPIAVGSFDFDDITVPNIDKDPNQGDAGGGRGRKNYNVWDDEEEEEDEDYSY